MKKAKTRMRAVVRKKRNHTRMQRLAIEAAKLDPREERALAEEGFALAALFGRKR